MDLYITKANIDHFKRLQKPETDKAKRSVLERRVCWLRKNESLPRRCDARETTTKLVSCHSRQCVG